jgi:tetratricopeptide (TPR) repeat protein
MFIDHLRGTAILGVLTLLASGAAWGQCGSLENPYGPFDYRTAPLPARRIVEIYHFTPDIENLVVRPTVYTDFGGNLDYTLRAFPNHPRALLAMMNLGFKKKKDLPDGSHYTMRCWFERAETFQPDDGVVQLLYGIYIFRTGDARGSIGKYKRALELGNDSVDVYYNLGLAYFEVKDYDAALANAHEAYRRGYPLPGLRTKLEKAGKWKPVPPGEPATGAARRDATAPSVDPAHGNDPAQPGAK